MAGSDKNTRRSVSSGSATESTQPISEAESSAVAGQLMDGLQKAAAARKTPSHEAKLGIAVITILVFAFCFLVYHKMDLAQRRLTQAAIGNGAGDDAAKVSAELQHEFAPGTESSDPLVTAAGIGAESPFAEPELDQAGTGRTETLPETTSNIPERSLAAFETPSDSSSTGFGLTEPGADIESSNTTESGSPTGSQESFPVVEFEPEAGRTPDAMPVEGASEAEPAFDSLETATAPRNESGFGEAFPVADNSVLNERAALPEETSGAQREPVLSMEPRATADASAEVDDPKSGEPESLPQFGDLAISEESSSQRAEVAEPELPAFDNSFGEQPLAGSPATAQRETAVPAVNSESPAEFAMNETGATSEQADDGIPQFPEVDADASTAAPSASDTDSSFTANATDETASEKDSQEPVLLAMAEPQEGSPFSGGFEADDSTSTSSRAPVSEPVFPVENGADFGQSARPAITNPSRKQKPTAIRNAAGSGADGKFSLAAFNYQNGAAEPAPDDGATFESVVVQDGDNYSKISKRVYGTVRYFSALAVFNQHRITDPKKMRSGMIVLTPDASILEERYPQLFVDSQPKTVEPAGFLVLEDGSPAYRVGERETLSEISERFLGRSSRWVEIYRLNQSVINDPNRLKAGLILALPEDAVEVGITP